MNKIFLCFSAANILRILYNSGSTNKKLRKINGSKFSAKPEGPLYLPKVLLWRNVDFPAGGPATRK
jgi:hypothetical protein